MTTATAPIKPPSRPAPPPPRSAPPAAAQVQATQWTIKPSEPKPVVPKIEIHAVEGFGKSTIAAYAPDPLILMARGETGYETLLSSRSVPAVPAIIVNSWSEIISGLDGLIQNPQGRKTIALDATGGFERLLHEKICAEQFKGDWEKFSSYGGFHGADTAVPDWLMLLSRLERLNSERGMIILLLGHAKVANFKNPMGPDFDRYTSDVHAKTWGPTLKWADVSLFGNFFSVIEKDKGKGKGIGGADRIIYTERRDAFDAKNRYRMKPEFWLTGVGPEGMWGAIWNEITGQGVQAATT